MRSAVNSRLRSIINDKVRNDCDSDAFARSGCNALTRRPVRNLPSAHSLQRAQYARHTRYTRIPCPSGHAQIVGFLIRTEKCPFRTSAGTSTIPPGSIVWFYSVPLGEGRDSICDVTAIPYQTSPKSSFTNHHTNHSYACLVSDSQEIKQCASGAREVQVTHRCTVVVFTKCAQTC